MTGKKFDSIDALVADIEKYRGAEVGNIYDGKYCVASVGKGTIEYIGEMLERLLERSRKKTQLFYLILEETDG